MRRLARHLFTLCSAVSLVLCVAACVLWVRSRGTVDRWQYQTAVVKLYAVQSVHGDLYLSEVDRRPDPFDYPPGFSHEHYLPSERWVSWTVSSPQHQYAKRMAGIGIIRGARYRKLVIAYWLISALLLIVPATWVWTRGRTRQRMLRGMCASCGYELRASPERCPECGAPAPTGTLRA